MLLLEDYIQQKKSKGGAQGRLYAGRLFEGNTDELNNKTTVACVNSLSTYL